MEFWVPTTEPFVGKEKGVLGKTHVQDRGQQGFPQYSSTTPAFSPYSEEQRVSPEACHDLTKVRIRSGIDQA